MLRLNDNIQVSIEIAAMSPDTEIWPVVLVSATVVIIFIALAASSTGSFECVGACG